MPLWTPLMSLVITSWLLTCTDLPWCGWSTVGTNFSEWVQIFQKNSFRGEPILGGSKLNVTGRRMSWCFWPGTCPARLSLRYRSLRHWPALTISVTCLSLVQSLYGTHYIPLSLVSNSHVPHFRSHVWMHITHYLCYFMHPLLFGINFHRNYTTSGKKKCWEKPQKCTCMSNALAFLFPSLRGPPEVWHYSWIQLSFKYLQLKS